MESRFETYYIDDLVSLYDLIISSKSLNSSVINCGGGINNSLSIIELINHIHKEFGIKPNYVKKRRD